MGKTTYNQLKAAKRKQFNSVLGGSIGLNQKLEFSDGTIGFYAREYDIDEERNTITMSYYLNEDSEEISGYLIGIPEEVFIMGKSYTIKPRKVAKPEYKIVPYKPKEKVAPIARPTSSAISGNSGLETKVGVEPTKTAPRKARELRDREFIKGNHGRRAH